MDYTTAYDVGDRKRETGINEDSVAVCVFADGHRDGLVRPIERRDGGDGDGTTGSDGDGDSTGPADSPTDLQSLLSGGDEGATDTDAEADEGHFDGTDGTAHPTDRTDAAAEVDERGDGADDSTDDGADGDIGDGGDAGTDGADTAAGDGRTDGAAAGPADGPESDSPAGSTPETRHAAVFALADGAGGYDAGDVASYITSTVVVEELAPLAIRAGRSDPGAFDVELDEPVPATPTVAEIQGAIADAIQTAHRRVLRYADAAGQPAFTTVVAGVAVDGELHYGWVGDSRAYVVSEALGRIEQLTRDHSVVADLAEAGDIDAVEAHVHPRGNEITTALGGHPGANVETATIGVETHTVPLWSDDVVLVTSDGLIDAQTDAPSLHDAYVAADGSDEVTERILEAVVTDDELCEGVLSAPSLDAAADDLLDLANRRGGKDNLSLILFQDPSLPAAPAPDRIPTRAIDPDEPLEDRQTVILPDE